MAAKFLEKLKDKLPSGEGGASIQDSKLAEKLGDWWAGLETKERRILQIGLPVILLLAFYLLVFNPVFSVYSERKAEYREAEKTLEWMYEQAPVIDRLQNSCGSRVVTMQGGDTPQTLLESIGSRTSVRVAIKEQASSAGMEVTVATSRGSRFLAFVQAVACNGYEITDLSVTRSAATASVSASFVAVPVTLPQKY